MPSVALPHQEARADCPRPAIFDSLAGRLVLLCLARYYDHKNLESLADLYRQCGDALRDVAILLTIAADQSSKAARLLAEMEREPLKGRLINVGPLKADDVAAYLHHSDGLILPTVLESFGGRILKPCSSPGRY